MVKPAVAEFLGTFMLVFAGTGAIVIGDVGGVEISHLGVALTFGLVVMTAIYAIGDISGAHINPAVTLGFWAAGRFPLNRVLPYVLAQFVGAILATTSLYLLFAPHPHWGATLPAGDFSQSFVLEIILTWWLMFVILRVSTGAKEKGIMAGAAIGSVVALEALFAGPISGASMNPARSLGPALYSGHLHSLWIYFAGPALGALLSVLSCHCVQRSKCCSWPGKEIPQ